MPRKPSTITIPFTEQVILPVFAPTRPEDVFGCLHVPGEKLRTLEDMEEAITAEIVARHAHRKRQ